MKKTLFALLLSASAFAGNGHVYLGGSTDVQSCANYAGSLGYAFGVYGAGYDDNGVYYPYFNACFGKGKKSEGPQLPYIPSPAPSPEPEPRQPELGGGKTVELPVTMDAQSMSAVLMQALQNAQANGNSRVRQTSKGLMMEEGRVRIHCYSGDLGGGGYSLPAVSQGCEITVR